MSRLPPPSGVSSSGQSAGEVERSSGRHGSSSVSRERPTSGRRLAPNLTGLPGEALAHADALHDFAYHLTANGAEAVHLVQETYARALRAADCFITGDNLKAWLFRILQHLFIDSYLGGHDRPTEGGSDTTDGESAACENFPAQGELEQSHLKQVVGREVEAALMRLTTQARLVILLDLQGFNEAELASLLQCTAGTVKLRLYRARAVLRQLLRDHLQG